MVSVLNIVILGRIVSQRESKKVENMSFSGKVKEELAGNISSARHCQIAELTAFIGMCGTVVINSFDRKRNYINL